MVEFRDFVSSLLDLVKHPETTRFVALPEAEGRSLSEMKEMVNAKDKDSIVVSSLVSPVVAPRGQKCVDDIFRVTVVGGSGYSFSESLKSTLGRVIDSDTIKRVWPKEPILDMDALRAFAESLKALLK